MKTQPIVTSKHVNFTMGGKGGTGKTTLILALIEYFREHEIPCTLLDFDIENKAKGGLAHYFDGEAKKLNIFTPTGLDAFVDQLDQGAPVILADMGAGSGRVTHDWFDSMYEAVAASGISFTAIGVVTDDPASVESVLAWASRLQDRCQYLIVENHQSEHDEMTYWRSSQQAAKFRETFSPLIMKMDFRIPDLENACRNHGVTLGEVANRKTKAAELQKTSLVIRAQAYRIKLFQEFDSIKEVLLP